MNKYKTALVVGRFQPFHLGHLYLIKTALQKADRIIIAIGSSNVTDKENPLSFETRVEMVKKVITEEGLGEKVTGIVASPDDPSDNIWLGKLIENTGNFDVLIGNNRWVNGIFKKENLPVIEIPYYERRLYQGIIVRKLFNSGDNWEERVPPYLVDFIRRVLSGKP